MADFDERVGYDDEEMEQGDQEERFIEEEKTPTQEFLDKAKWYGISFVIHALLIVLSLFWYVGLSASQENIIVSIPREIPDMLQEEEKDIDDKDVELEKKEEILMTEKDEETNESPSDEPFESVEGESFDNISDKPFKGQWANDVIGAGGGAGGAYGGPHGGMALKRKGGGGGSGKAREAVLNALRWLMRHQNDDGSWDVKEYVKNCGSHSKFPGRCNPNPGTTYFKAGITGLAILAFTGAGYTHMDKEVDKVTGLVFGEAVRKGMEYLISIQQEDGCLTEKTGEYMYNHLVATFALCDDYGLTGSPLLKDPVEEAVKFALYSQNDGGGVRYESKSGESDSSVTGWLAQVYKYANMAGVEVPQQAKDWVIAWYDSVTDPKYYWVGYQEKVNLPVVLQGVNDNMRFYPSLTAIGLMARIFFEPQNEKYINGHARWLQSKDENKMQWESDIDPDFYYWYYASYALYQKGGKYWDWWEKPLEKVMIDHQNTEMNCKHGSWEPVDKWSYAGGRVYTTAMGALILEVFYRFPAGDLTKRGK